MLCDANAAGSVQCYPVGGCAGAFGFCSAAHLWSCTFSSGSEIFRGILLGSQFLVSPDPSSSAFSASLCQGFALSCTVSCCFSCVRYTPALCYAHSVVFIDLILALQLCDQVSAGSVRCLYRDGGCAGASGGCDPDYLWSSSSSTSYHFAFLHIGGVFTGGTYSSSFPFSVRLL